jgi:polysaccharide pyruvyl transferase WcaK-like protein
VIIEIVGCSTRNKGAELLLIAIKDHFVNEKEIDWAVSDFFGPWPERAKYGLRGRINGRRGYRQRFCSAAMGKKARLANGLVSDGDVDIILDASGFAYGDQHGIRPLRKNADYYSSMKRRGKRIILLPQAFGPFEKPGMKEQASRLIDAADLIYARDKHSFGYLTNVAPSCPNIRRAPDITIGLAVDSSDHRSPNGPFRIALVPNMRMMDKNEKSISELYIPFMISIIHNLMNQDVEAVLLVHDSDEDISLAKKINDGLNSPLQILQESDPVCLKRIISRFDLLIGSRFHALVSALSQGVPSICIGWSHKYENLMMDYGLADNVIALSSDGAAWCAIERLLDRRTWAHQKKTIESRKQAMIDEINAMWSEIGSALHKWRA